MAAELEMIEIFNARQQQAKVRWLSWFALLLFFASLYWGYSLSQTYGLSQGDGGLLRPRWERWMVGGFVAFLGLIFILGMDVYGRLYISRAMWDESARMVLFETVRWWGVGQMRVPVAEIVGSHFESGDFYTIRHQVNAPWYFVRLRGRRLPLILDGQGVFPQPGLARNLLNLKG
jgi:hypothetical protein